MRAHARSVGRAFAQLRETASDSDHFRAGQRPSAGEQTVSVESLDSMMFHLTLVTLVMLIGYVLRLPFVLAEELFPTGSFFEKVRAAAAASLLVVGGVSHFCWLRVHFFAGCVSPFCWLRVPAAIALLVV